jgi:hypothetical protein
LEALEDRLTPAPVTVTTTLDVDQNGNPVAGSLRAAIIVVNAGINHGINFNIGNAAQTITVQKTALPALTKPVTIDGTPPAGKANQTIALTPDVGANAPPPGTNGLVLQAGASGSKVYGLTIYEFPGDGIQLDGASSVELGAADNGTTITNGKGRNVIYGNTANGIEIRGDGATNNSIVASIIGTDANSTPNIGNRADGVSISPLSGTTNHIGAGPIATGKVSDGLNVISGNVADGVYIGTDGNTIAGNYIGTTVDGTAKLANGGVGVNVSGHANTTIGAQVTVVKGMIVTPANVISGNAKAAISLWGDNNKVYGNFIGTDVTGKRLSHIRTAVHSADKFSP